MTSSPAGATVSVNGAKRGVTPLDVRLERKSKNQVIRIEYPGYNPLEIRMRRSASSPHLLIDGLLGGITGYTIAAAVFMAHDETANGGSLLLTWVPAMIGAFLLIDLGVGTGYNVNPGDLIVTLSRTEGSPRVDTMYVDPDEFRNVKWIRVRRD